MTRVSVGIPVYNGEKYLAETLDSLLAQSLQEFEIVISDDASTDRTPEICRCYEAKDSRIRYSRNARNIGGAPNFNRVVKLSRAPLFHGGACDALYEPSFLARCVDALERDPGVVLSHTRSKLVGDKGELLLFDRKRAGYVDRDDHLKGTSGDVMRPQSSHIGQSANPETRFREVLWCGAWSLPLSGVIRKKALLRTSRYGKYSGVDKALLAELALQGRFHEVDQELSARGIHHSCTRYKTPRVRAPHETRGSRGISQVLALRDYAKMVFAADISAAQRLHCMVTIVGMAHRRGIGRCRLVPGPDNYCGLSFADK
jgi:hypothetical protein